MKKRIALVGVAVALLAAGLILPGILESTKSEKDQQAAPAPQPTETRTLVVDSIPSPLVVDNNPAVITYRTLFNRGSFKIIDQNLVVFLNGQYHTCAHQKVNLN